MSLNEGDSDGLGYKAFQGALIRIASDLSRLSAAANTGDLTDLAQGADERLDHLAEGNFVVAMIGAFKRGKSTLTNALLGDTIMPADVDPATATLNRVTYGRHPRATLKMNDGRSVVIGIDELSQYVTKLTEESAQRAREIDEAVIEYPTYLCANNVQLLDTPGLDDNADMTSLTESVFPKIDAAIFITNGTTALGVSELKALSHLLQHMDRSCIALAVTHFDLVDEEDRERVLDSVRKRAAPLLGFEPPVFGVAARAGLKAKKAHDDKALRASGLMDLEEWLERFLVRESGLARLRAANETVLNLANDLDDKITEKLDAYLLIDEAQKARLAALKHELDSVRTDLDLWINDVTDWPGETAAIDAIASPMAGELSRLASTLVPSLTASDVSNPEARHQRLRERINHQVKARFDSQIDEMQTMLVDLADLQRDLLANLSARWDVVRAARLDAPDAAQGVVDAGPFDEINAALLAHQKGFDDAKARFAYAYDSNCNFMSFTGAMTRWFSNVTQETIMAVKTGTEEHVSYVATSATNTADPAGTGRRYVSACAGSLKPFAEKMKAEIASSIDYLKWSLDLRGAQLETTRAVGGERLRLTQTTARDIQSQAETRRGVLQQLAIVSTPEDRHAQSMPHTA
jgi:GTPase SAR1 family protein